MIKELNKYMPKLIEMNALPFKNEMNWGFLKEFEY
jgi:hypothetical protein